MPISANDTKRKSWLEVAQKVISQFKTSHLVFFNQENVVTVGTRIGDSAIDLGALQQLNYFEGIELTDMFMQDTLNDFISDGKKRGDWYVIVS
jgi:fumarylacetoacetase